ncbi:SDR family oxidoreductase [Compostibacter hankyongensis]|uniref:dTDP-4-dehydrorhamnose reductase n=1 Tax=Compostibacter hankyongensis TaxID=1007089 RepID=A0ABP8G459_9BACT
MKVLITGTNGLLGQHLVKQFRQMPDCSVVATARGENRLRDREGYVYAPMDIADPAQISEVMRREAPDSIIHSAAMTQVDDCETQRERCWQSNVQATRYLVEAARELGAYFQLVSTDFIFDGEQGPYPEDALPNPVNYYGLSKLAAEQLLPCSGLEWSVIRTILVYGVAEDPARSNIVLWVKKSLESGRKIKVVTDQWRMPTLVDDLAAGCILAAERRATGVFHISGSELLTPYDMALQVADYFGLDKGLIEKADGSTFTQPARRPARTGFVLDKSRQQLGYQPHTFKEGLTVMEEGAGK